MCRMLALRAPSIKQAQEVLTNFRQQALDSRPDPEGGQRDHRDGWGLVTLGEGEVRYLSRRPYDVSQDEFFDKAMDMMRNAPKNAGFLCHFRRASAGPVALENTHPFMAQGWAFAHNGGIRGNIDDVNIQYEGATDTERFFKKVLKHMKVQPTFEDALRRCVREIQGQAEFSALTFLMTNGDVLYGYVRIGTDEKNQWDHDQAAQYYSLGWGRSGKSTIVAQEPTHLGDFDEWHDVPDDSLLVWKRGRAPEIVPLGLLTTPSTS